MLDDWYLNERTGELYYNEELTSNTANVEGQDYQRVGDNEMMGDMAEITEKSYNFTESQEIANQNGFSILPSQQIVDDQTYVNHVPTGRSSIRIETGVVTTINEKYTITPTNSTRNLYDYDKLSSSGFWSSVKSIILGSNSSTQRRYYTYSPSSKQTSKNGNYLYNNIGDGVTYRNYDSWGHYNAATNGKGDLLKYKQ